MPILFIIYCKLTNFIYKTNISNKKTPENNPGSVQTITKKYKLIFSVIRVILSDAEFSFQLSNKVSILKQLISRLYPDIRPCYELLNDRKKHICIVAHRPYPNLP